MVYLFAFYLFGLGTTVLRYPINGFLEDDRVMLPLGKRKRYDLGSVILLTINLF